VARDIFQACPVWIYTQSNIKQTSYSPEYITPTQQISNNEYYTLPIQELWGGARGGVEVDPPPHTHTTELVNCFPSRQHGNWADMKEKKKKC
jgi:hypothetical protein